jgi:hypothetical protein
MDSASKFVYYPDADRPLAEIRRRAILAIAPIHLLLVVVNYAGFTEVRRWIEPITGDGVVDICTIRDKDYMVGKFGRSNVAVMFFQGCDSFDFEEDLRMACEQWSPKTVVLVSTMSVNEHANVAVGDIVVAHSVCLQDEGRGELIVPLSQDVLCNFYSFGTMGWHFNGAAVRIKKVAGESATFVPRSSVGVVRWTDSLYRVCGTAIPWTSVSGIEKTVSSGDGVRLDVHRFCLAAAVSLVHYTNRLC